LKKIALFLFILTLFICSFIVYLPQAKKQEVTLTKIGVYEINGSLFDIQVINDIAYACEYSNNKLYIIDVSDPKTPYSLANITVNLPHNIDIEDEVVYISVWNQGIQILDISDATNPSTIGNYVSGTVGHVNVEANIAFAGGLYGMNIINMSDPSNPESINFMCDDMGVHNTFIQNNIIYILAWNSTTDLDWIMAYDITDIMNPTKLGEFEIGSQGTDVFVKDNVAYIANEYNGVLLLNFTDFLNPSIIYRYDDVGSASELEVHDNILYLANGYTGVELIDITNKTNPILLTKHFDGGQSDSFELHDDLIYVGDSGDGLEILQIQGLKTDSIPGFGLSSFFLLNLYVLFIVAKRRQRVKK
jgi:hypothetical protein